MRAGKKSTTDIFGDFLDAYTIRQAEEDGSVVPILYELTGVWCPPWRGKVARGFGLGAWLTGRFGTSPVLPWRLCARM